jgi:hypothetical protein
MLVYAEIFTPASKMSKRLMAKVEIKGREYELD